MEIVLGSSSDGAVLKQVVKCNMFILIGNDALGDSKISLPEKKSLFSTSGNRAVENPFS